MGSTTWLPACLLLAVHGEPQTSLPPRATTTVLKSEERPPPLPSTVVIRLRGQEAELKSGAEKLMRQKAAAAEREVSSRDMPRSVLRGPMKQVPGTGVAEERVSSFVLQ